MKKPSTSAHIMVLLTLISPIMVLFTLCIQVFRAKGSFEKTWDGLAAWFDESLD